MIAPPSDGLVDRPLALSPADIRLYSSMSVACGMLCKRRQSHSGGQSEPAHKQCQLLYKQCTDNKSFIDYHTAHKSGLCTNEVDKYPAAHIAILVQPLCGVLRVAPPRTAQLSYTCRLRCG